MGDLTATVVIEERSLIREALVSLMESHSYKVICSLGSPADLDCNALKDEQPKLVMLGALPVGSLPDTTSRIRRCWHAAKIIVLFDNTSSEDLQRLIASDVDACIPMGASPRILINTLQLIVCEPFRVFVLGGAEITYGLSTQTLKNGEALAAEVASSLQAPSCIAIPCAARSAAKAAVDGADSDYRRYALSEREEQILKALARGYSNKMIARVHSVTEATIKAHMKSILRKIRVANRTQAAIWALRNSYFSEGLNEGASDVPREVRLVDGHSSLTGAIGSRPCEAGGRPIEALSDSSKVSPSHLRTPTAPRSPKRS
jgi:two-component system nitrate/nitrite response regulator NarL